jgi:toxin FitB
MRALLDTSILIGEEPPPDVEAAISVASIAELHFGVLVTSDEDERAIRTNRLGAIESTFDALPITVEIAREWGRLSAAVRNRCGRPRRRTIDLVIAATANVHGVPLLTHNTADFQIISDLTDARHPSELPASEQDPDVPAAEE